MGSGETPHIRSTVYIYILSRFSTWPIGHERMGDTYIHRADVYKKHFSLMIHANLKTPCLIALHMNILNRETPTELHNKT